MDGWMNDEWMNEWTDEWMDGWMNERMEAMLNELEWLLNYIHRMNSVRGGFQYLSALNSIIHNILNPMLTITTFFFNPFVYFFFLKFVYKWIYNYLDAIININNDIISLTSNKAKQTSQSTVTSHVEIFVGDVTTQTWPKLGLRNLCRRYINGSFPVFL